MYLRSTPCVAKETGVLVCLACTCLCCHHADPFARELAISVPCIAAVSIKRETHRPTHGVYVAYKWRIGAWVAWYRRRGVSERGVGVCMCVCVWGGSGINSLIHLLSSMQSALVMANDLERCSLLKFKVWYHLHRCLQAGSVTLHLKPSDATDESSFVPGSGRRTIGAHRADLSNVHGRSHFDTVHNGQQG